MEDKYDVSDLVYIRIMLEDIINIADRTTSGNVAHNLAAIKVNSRCALNALNEFKEKHDIS